VEVAVESAGPDLARLSVRDHGIGIASRDLRLLFHPFQRLHPNHHYRGFGLGLFIVSEIVRAHGGNVKVESEPDKGARFTVELPMVVRRVAGIE
jgi:signal transduction histidine kinase